MCNGVRHVLLNHHIGTQAYADCVVRDVGDGGRHAKIKQSFVPVKDRF